MEENKEIVETVATPEEEGKQETVSNKNSKAKRSRA